MLTHLYRFSEKFLSGLGFKNRAETEKQAFIKDLYFAIVSASRNPVLYTKMRVPDTLDGRFDSLVAHFFIVVNRLNARQEAETVKGLADWLITDSDRSLRETGVSDHSIARKMRAVGEAYAGRMAAYEKACAEEDKIDALAQAIVRNVYRGDTHYQAEAFLFAEYLLAVREKIDHLPRISPEHIIQTFEQIAHTTFIKRH